MMAPQWQVDLRDLSAILIEMFDKSRVEQQGLTGVLMIRQKKKKRRIFYCIGGKRGTNGNRSLDHQKLLYYFMYLAKLYSADR